jgi:hypothetical protein
MKKIGTYLIIALVIFIGVKVKGCVVNTISIDNYLLVERTDGPQISRVLITPKNEMLIAKKYQDVREVGLYKIKGVYATKYFPGVYNFNSKGIFPLGLRVYPHALQAFDSDIELVKKEGNSFPNEGSKYSVKIIVYNDHIIKGKDKWERVTVSDEDKNQMSYMIQHFKSNI